MLPATARLTDRDDFTTVVRRGRRSGRTLVVMHVLLPESSGSAAGDGPVVDSARFGSSRVGFVVSKAVGGSVVRHRVARRLRHLMRDRLADAPSGSRIVVRALPASAQADSASLGAELDRALRGALLSKAPERRRPRPSDPASLDPAATPSPSSPRVTDRPPASSRS